MEANQPAATLRSLTPFAIIAAVVLSFLWFSVQNPSKQVAELSGVIEAVTFRGATDDPLASDRTAVIRLADGTIVQAHIVTPLNVHAGQRARVAVYERVLSAERTYKLVEARDAN
ncbi:MAG TPA: hypothetical protein VFJ70_02885 [Burkholderiales bacterium]|nr:hypothetical protein [Burkholderiales bacterium]